MCAYKHNGRSFLMVDNQAEQLDVWCKLVERVTGSRPRTADSWEAAIQAMRSAPVDVLVVDLFLTVESERRGELDESEGLRLIAECRRQYPDCRIVAITSKLGDTARGGAAALREGADDFVSTAWPHVHPSSLLEQKLRILFELLPLRDRGTGALRLTVEDVRERWVGFEKKPRSLRIALTVLHGFVEQVPAALEAPEVHAFLQKQFGLITKGEASPVTLENEAAAYRLPVCTPGEPVEAMSASFGFVEEITNHQARVILLDEDDREVKSDVTVPLVWLPRAYRREGAGVAWVERQYALGVKGRFEPASAGE